MRRKYEQADFRNVGGKKNKKMETADVARVMRSAGTVKFLLALPAFQSLSLSSASYWQKLAGALAGKE